jgi:hypothetical protein
MTVGVVMAVVGIVAEVVNQVTGNADRQAAEKAMRKQAKRNKQLALEVLGEQTFDIRLRTTQQRAQIGEEINKITRSEILQTGGIASSAGAANVAGQTVGDLVLDTKVQAERGKGNLRLLQEFRELDAEREIQALRLGTRGRILGLQPNPVNGPNFFQQSNAIFAQGLQGFQIGQQISSAQQSDAVDTRSSGGSSSGSSTPTGDVGGSSPIT